MHIAHYRPLKEVSRVEKNGVSGFRESSRCAESSCTCGQQRAALWLACTDVPAMGTFMLGAFSAEVRVLRMAPLELDAAQCGCFCRLGGPSEWCLSPARNPASPIGNIRVEHAIQSRTSIERLIGFWTRPACRSELWPLRGLVRKGVEVRGHRSNRCVHNGFISVRHEREVAVED